MLKVTAQQRATKEEPRKKDGEGEGEGVGGTGGVPIMQNKTLSEGNLDLGWVAPAGGALTRCGGCDLSNRKCVHSANGRDGRDKYAPGGRWAE